MQHTNFQIDGTNYLLESNCHQHTWPRLIDKVHKYLERYGKHVRKHYGSDLSATSKGKTTIGGVEVHFHVTINPKGLNSVIERPRFGCSYCKG